MRFRRFIYGCMLLKCVRVELKLIQDLVITIRYQFERIPTTEAASIIYSLNGLLYSQVPLDQRGNYKRYQFRSVYHSNLLNIKCSLEKNDDYFEILQKKSNFEILMITSFQSNDDYYVKIDENSRKFGKIQIILEPL